MVTRKKRTEGSKKDDPKTEVVVGNLPLLTVQLLNDINRNLGVLITYIKNRDLEKKR